MKVELSRFRIKSGKSERVDDWLNMLNSNISEAIQTLDREQMKLEIIFREMIDGADYLYWFSVQGEAAQSLETSPFEVDARHIEFWNECIDEDYGRHDAQPQVIMVPVEIAKAMGWESPCGAAVKFERREIVYKRTG
jgi:hypothetical protein